MNKIFCKIILVFLITISYSSPGDASAVFLLISPGASAVGSGEAQVAKADDAYATYFNPAGLAFQTGKEYAGMHVNWLPGLADDIYYEFAAYKQHIPWLGTIGGNITFLNLGEQQGTDEFGNPTDNFKSYMWALTASYGTKINETAAWGTNFKLIHQKLADSATGAEAQGSGKPYSTDFAFDIGYLKKFKNLNFGFAIANIGPEVDFIDKQQADPLPTNMKIGIFTTLYQDENKRLNFLFDANKMLVARYESMDWNGDGIINSNKEEGFFDPWYKAIYTSWLDDWYYGGDRNISVGTADADIYNNEFLSDGITPDPNYGNSIIGGYAHFEADGIPGITPGDDFIRTEDEDGNLLGFSDPNYGIYNSEGVKEKGSGDERDFSDELNDMIYSLGFEFWYTENFALRLGFLHDKEGNLKHPTLGAGISFGQYGFDLGYILGKEGEPRSNTLLFSLNMSIDGVENISE